jgi:hypothetical protein
MSSGIVEINSLQWTASGNVIGQSLSGINRHAFGRLYDLHYTGVPPISQHLCNAFKYEEFVNNSAFRVAERYLQVPGQKVTNISI